MPANLETIEKLLQKQLPGAQLTCQELPSCGGLALYLIGPTFDDRDLPQQVRESISDDPPYWIFCWASGRALAQMIIDGEIDVRNKRILDFGAGSGVVAIAAMLAGAHSATACDIDPVSHKLIALNSKANQTKVDISARLEECGQGFDLVFAADVLYEQKNLVWLDVLLTVGERVIVADSRQKRLDHPRYRKLRQFVTTSFPDFAEAKTYNDVNIYRSE